MEKDIQLRELIHRMKNNLAVITGMFDLHMDYIEDPDSRAIFQSFQIRVISMTLINEYAYTHGTFSKIDFNNFVKEMVKKIGNFYQEKTKHITLDINIDDVKLDLEKAMPCGLIINELITNVFKHAYKQNDMGKLSVSFSEKEGVHTLIISDGGIGVINEAQLLQPKSLGYIFVNALVLQLKGRMEIDNNSRGLSIQITF